MLVAERTDLAEALDGWRRKQRVEWTHVSRVSGVSRNTIYNALDGGRPTSDALRKVARGLATDPHSGELDRIVFEEIVRDLFGIAGFDVPVDAGTVLSFEDEILKRVKRRDDSRTVREVLDNWDELSTADREMLLAAFRAALQD